MKITFLLTWADEMGGTELAVFTQAEHLAPRHEVEVLSVFRTRPESFFGTDSRIPVRYLVDRTGDTPSPTRPSELTEQECARLAALPSTLVDPAWESAFDALSDIEASRALRALDTDVLVTTSPALLVLATGLTPARVLTVHQEHRPSQVRGARGEPLLLSAPGIDALVLLTERTRDWFAETLGAAAPRLEVIPNAVPEGFRPRSALSGKSIVMPRRLVANKRVHHAIEAFARVLPEYPGWRLRIFGDGPQSGRLRSLITELGLHDSVEFLGPSQHMTEEWAKASFTVLPSDHGEAFPLVLLEAFAAGVPAVAYDILTGPAEIIRHGEDGLLVPSGDIEALAAAMSRLMGDEELLRTMGARALEGVARFDADEITDRWEKLYAELLAGQDRPERADRRADRMARRSGSSRQDPEEATGAGPDEQDEQILSAGRFHSVAAVDNLAASTGDQKDREDALLAEAGAATGTGVDLVRSGGRIAEVRDDLRPDDVAHRNFRTVSDALERHGIPHVVLRGPEPEQRQRIGVDSALVAAACRALAAETAGRPVYAELIKPRTAAPGAVLGELLDGRLHDSACLRVFQPVISSTRTLGLGPAYGCDLEFWERQPDGAKEAPGAFTAPGRKTAVGRVLPTLDADAHITVRDREHPTLRPFTRLLDRDIDFPVDAVYTWVDDSDEAWQRRRAERRTSLGMEPAAPGSAISGDEDARFRNRDELRYSLRSLAMFAPWIRRIFLVTDDQVPSWLNTGHPGIRVVSHREIFDNPAVQLPTFNSHAIESRLHRIEGLSEHFLYLNDDFFLASANRPQHYFRANGHPLFFRSPTAVPAGPVSETDEAYFAAAKNNRELLEARFGRTVTHGYLHAPYALRRSVLARIEEEFPEAVARTAANPMRSRSDVSLVSSLHHSYGWFTGESEPGKLRCAYIDAGDRAMHPRMTSLLTSRSHQVFCINESPDAEVPPDEQARVVRAFLTAYFPLPSPFER